MVLSFVIGIFLIGFGIIHKSEKKSKQWKGISIAVGIVFLLIAVWLAFPK